MVAATDPKSFAEVNATFLFVKVNATPFVAFTLAINKTFKIADFLLPTTPIHAYI